MVFVLTNSSMTDLSACMYYFVRFVSFVVVEILVPLSKLPQPFSQCNLWCKPEVTFKGCGISIGGGNITRLHGDELFVSLEVEVSGKDTGANQFLL